MNSAEVEFVYKISFCGKLSANISMDVMTQGVRLMPKVSKLTLF